MPLNTIVLPLNTIDSFPFDFEPNGFPFGSKSKGKLSPRSYSIQCERKWNTSFLRVQLSARLVTDLHPPSPHLKALKHHNTMVLWCLRGPKLGPYKATRR